MVSGFDPSSVGVVAITYYPNWYLGKLRSIKHTDKIRGDLAMDFIKKTIALGCRLVIVDSKSSKTFKKELQSFPKALVITKSSPKRSPKRRVGVLAASKIEGVKFIVTTEAEKTSIITDCLEEIVKPLLNKEADIVVPRRNEELFKSKYPDYMYVSETEGNKIYNESLRANGLLSKEVRELDFFFGPRAFLNKKEILDLFLRKFVFKSEKFYKLYSLYDPEEYSNSAYFPIILALKKGLKVMDVEVPFAYPKIQKENEEVGSREEFLRKRQLQKTSLLIDLMHFVSYLEKRASSGIKKN